MMEKVVFTVLMIILVLIGAGYLFGVGFSLAQ